MATVIITETTVQPPLQVATTDVLTYRAWYSASFVAADGTTPIEGGDGQSGFYYEYDCTLDGSGNVVIPAQTVQPTTGSNPTAGFFGGLFVNDAFNRMVFGVPQATAGWQIPTSPTTTTFGLLALYNAAVQLLYPPNTYPTFDQVVRLFHQLTELAAVGVAGVTQLSYPPDDPAVPIAFGANDPAVGDIHGNLTQFRVPRAGATKTIEDGLAVDDGTDFSVQTTGSFQAGDFGVEQHGSFLGVNDALTDDGGRTNLYAGGDNGNEYAGVSADCSSGVGEINVQSTGITNLYGVNQITALGDGKNEQQGTQVVINDPLRMVTQTAVNQIPNDPSLNTEQICLFLDENAGSLKARIRLSDGTYAMWEGAYTPD